MYARPTLAPRQCKQNNHDGEGQYIRNQADNGQELGQLGRRPSPLQIAAAMEDGDAGNGERKDVALDERRGDEGPWVDDGQLGHEGQVGDDDVSVLGPLAVADGGAEEGLEDEDDEDGARDGRDVEPRSHGGGEGCRRCDGGWEVVEVLRTRPLGKVGRGWCGARLIGGGKAVALQVYRLSSL